MEGGYMVIPSVALGCYIILLFAFLVSKRNKIAGRFQMFIIACIIWNLGSLIMRSAQTPAFIKFGFHFSITGLFLLPSTFFLFVEQYVGIRKKIPEYLMVGSCIAIIVINILGDGIFLKEPELIDGNYVYSFTGLVAIPYIILTVSFIYVLYFIWVSISLHKVPGREIKAILSGIFIIFFGNIIVLMPVFSGFPIDMFAGLVSAVLFYVVLSKNERFSLTPRYVTSKRVFSIAAAIIAIGTIYSVRRALVSEIFEAIGWRFGITHIDTFVSLFVVGICTVVILGMDWFMDHIFFGKEDEQAEGYISFTDKIGKALSSLEVMLTIKGHIEGKIKNLKIELFRCDEDKNCYQYVPMLNNWGESCPKGWGIKIPEARTLEKYFVVETHAADINSLSFVKEFSPTLQEKLRGLSNSEGALILPIVTEGKVPILILCTPTGSRKVFTRTEKRYLESIASTSGIAVHNANMYDKLWKESRTDYLTGIGNRTAFYEQLETNNEADEYPQALIYFKLDYFTMFNQLYGYETADKMLCMFAGVLKRTIGNNGNVFRIAGTEFTASVNGKTESEVYEIAEAVRNATMEIKDIDMVNQTMLTVTCGVAMRESSEITSERMFECARKAVSQGKAAGKNTVVVYKEEVALTNDRNTSFELYEASIRALLAAIDAKDHYTFNHSQNVAYYAMELARNNDMEASMVELVREAGLLHDIGKIGISESVLKKPGRLTEEEFSVMKGHVEQSVEIIKHLPSLESVIPYVYGHHERYDGKGYPRGLAGENIPLIARILCIADSFDAMMSKRSYKDKYSLEYSVSQLRDCAGSQFDPKLAERFIELLEKGNIKVRYSGPDA